MKDLGLCCLHARLVFALSHLNPNFDLYCVVTEIYYLNMALALFNTGTCYI